MLGRERKEGRAKKADIEYDRFNIAAGVGGGGSSKGRVALVHRGEGAGKLVVVVDIIDQNRVLVDWDGMDRQQVRSPRGTPHGHGHTAMGRDAV